MTELAMWLRFIFATIALQCITCALRHLAI
jgi:hypothetical protein